MTLETCVDLACQERWTYVYIFGRFLSILGQIEISEYAHHFGICVDNNLWVAFLYIDKC